MFKKLTLKNGIRVVYEKIPYVNSISIGVWIGSGSRFEDETNNGVSHFIEHMMFKGTKNRTAKQIAEDIEDLGGQINAFTGKEATCYYVKMLDAHFKIGIDVLSDMIKNPRFSDEDIHKEKGVVIEEINMYEDSPEDLVADLLSAATWGDDSLSLPILGYTKTIKNLNKEKVITYFNKTYSPQNTVISIAGNFNEDLIIEKIKNKFEDWSAKDDALISFSNPEIKSNILVKNKDIEQVHVALTLDGIELGNEKLYALLAVNNYFGGGTSSRLFQVLREEMAYVYTIYSYTSSYKNKGIFNIQFALNKIFLEKAMNSVANEIKSLMDKKISLEQLNKIKEQLKGSYILGLESVSSRMFGIGKSELMLDKVYEPKEVLKKIDDISMDDINEIIEHVFSKGIISAAAVGRKIKEDKFKKLIGDCNEIIFKKS